MTKPSSPSLSMPIIPSLVLLGVAVIWGIAFVPVKQAAVNHSPLLFVLLRFLIAAMFLSLFFLGQYFLRPSSNGKKTLDLRHLMRVGLISGFFFGGGFVLQTWGLVTTTASKSAFLTGLYVIFVPLLSWVFLRGKIKSWEWSGAGIALIGIVLLSVPDISMLRTMSIGDLLSIACAIAFAAHILTISHFCRGIDPIGFAWAQTISVSIFLGVLLLMIEGIPTSLPAELIWLALLTSIMSNVICLSAQVWAQRHLSPTVATIIMASEPIFATLASWLILEERFTWRELLGMAVLMGAIALVQVGILKPLRTRKPLAHSAD